MSVEKDKLEWEVKRHSDMALILADQLNAKIDECEALKKKVAELEEKLYLADHVDPSGGAWAWEQ